MSSNESRLTLRKKKKKMPFLLTSYLKAFLRAVATMCHRKEEAGMQVVAATTTGVSGPSVSDGVTMWFGRQRQALEAESSPQLGCLCYPP